MALVQQRYTMTEFAQRGTAIYERLQAHFDADARGKIVAIDIDTEAFEIADDVLTSADHLRHHNPEAQIWFVRIGHRGVHRFGPRAIPDAL